MMDDIIFKIAFQLAQEAYKADEVPVGAVIFKTGTHEIVAQARNRTEETHSPLAHAELLAIDEACRRLGQKRLVGYSLFVTLEPCAMCAGAIAWARLDNLFFGAYDPKSGAVEQGASVFVHPQTHHKPHIQGGIEAERCGNLLSDFFQKKRSRQNKSTIG